MEKSRFIRNPKVKNSSETYTVDVDETRGVYGRGKKYLFKYRIGKELSIKDENYIKSILINPQVFIDRFSCFEEKSEIESFEDYFILKKNDIAFGFKVVFQQQFFASAYEKTLFIIEKDKIQDLIELVLSKIHNAVGFILTPKNSDFLELKEGYLVFGIEHVFACKK